MDALLRGLTQETDGRGRFVGFAAADLLQASETLVWYRLSTLEIIRYTERDARRLFLNECRGAERNAFREMQLLIHLVANFAPTTAKIRTDVKGPAYEEVAIHRTMAEYTADLRGIGGFLKPNRPTINYVSRELAIGKTMGPQVHHLYRAESS